MAYGAYDFNIVQFGRESVAGTAVPTTEIHRGPAIDIEDASAYARTDEQTGIMALTGNRYKANLQALLNLPAYPFTFDHGPHVFEAGILAATPVGTTSPYVRTYDFDVVAADVATKVIKTYTWETGNKLVTGDSNEMEYAFVESFTLTGAINEPWMIEPVWRGRQKSTCTLTADLTLDTVTEAMFSNAALYIDNVGGTVGTTAVAGVLVGASIDVVTGVVPVWAPSGALYFSTHKFVRPTITGSLTMELESTAGTVYAERAYYAAGTVRQIRIKTTGASSRYWQFDAAINWTNFGTYENQDGDTVVTAEWEAVYSSADALLAEFKVSNTVASYDA